MSQRLLLLCCLLPIWLGAGEEPEPWVAVAAQMPAIPLATEPPLAARTEQQPDTAAYEIGAYVAKYEVRYSGLKVGELTQRLTEKKNGRQTLQTVAYTTGLVSWVKPDKVVERSIWRDEAGELLPISYTYRYSGTRKEVFERLDFDWQTGEVASLRDGKVTTLAVERGTLDKHMYQMVLRQDLLKGLRPLNYSVADRSKLKQYEFEVLGEEWVETKDFGKLNCLKIKKGTTLIWAAARFDYLPVRIEQEEEGTVTGSYLIEFKGE
jgi:hypothetical protein